MDRAAYRRVGKTVRTAVTETLESRCLLSASSSLLSQTPAVFIQNEGQWSDPSIRYAFQGNGANVLMTDAGPVFQVFKPGGGEQFFVQFDNSNTTTPAGLDAVGSAANYFVGDPSTWRANVPGYSKIEYKNIYNGVDLYTWGQQDNLKYEFHVAPGADPSQVQVSYNGIKGLSIDSDGNLHIKTSFGELIDAAPIVYQNINGKKVQVKSEFKLLSKDSYTFQLDGSYDHSQELILDPNLAWSTFLGGAGVDNGAGIAVDSSDNSYITGTTASIDFPHTQGFNPDLGGSSDAFITKLDPNGAFIWSTYLGGSGTDSGAGIALDSAGANLYVTGSTSSTDFPTTGGFDTALSGTTDAFVVKVNSLGVFQWGTYLGGSGVDSGNGIALDGTNNIYVGGNTTSADFPHTGGFDTALNGVTDGFVTKISPAATPAIVWSTYVGGNANDSVNGIDVTTQGVVSVVGNTTSTNLATVGAADTTYGGAGDAFVMNILTNGTENWATYYGGSGADNGLAIAVGGNGVIAITGSTTSTDLVVSGNAQDTVLGGGTDAFLATYNAAGTVGISTYLGGTGNDVGNGVAVDTNGNIIVVGSTSSTAFPTTGGFDTTYNGGTSDAFVTSFSGTGTINFSTFIGGGAADAANAVVVDANDDILLTGSTLSTDFPVLGAFDLTYNGSGDAFVTKISASNNFNTPFPPFNVVATSTSFTSVNLTWQFQDFFGTGVLGFKIFRKKDPSGSYIQIATVSGTTRKYTDTNNILPDATYYYRIKAFNASGDSQYSDPAAKVITLSAALHAPTALTATPISGTEIDLSWTDNSNNESGFEIWRTVVGGSLTKLTTVGINVTTFKDKSGLAPATQYEYEVRAVNAFRTSNFTTPAFATTESATFLVAPSGLTANRASGDSVVLNWEDNSSNETGFEIQRAVINTGNFVQIGTAIAGATSFTDSAADSGTVFEYRVRAVNNSDVSAFSNVATSDLTTALGQPLRFEALAIADDKITLSWIDNATIETHYLLERKIGSNGQFSLVATLPPNTTSYTDKNLVVNTQYFYRLRATDGTNFSPYSEVSGDKTLKLGQVVPNTPSALKGKALGTTSIKLNWRDNSNDETQFQIERAPTATGDFVVVDTVGPNVTTYTDNNLAEGTTYYYRVRARNGTVRSSASPIVKVETVALPTLTITASDPTGTEGAHDPIVFTIRRKNGSSDAALPVSYSIGGTATNGKDYPKLSGLTMIPEKASSVQIVIQPIDDSAPEDTQTIKLTLIREKGYRVSPSMRSATADIIDNDSVHVNSLAQAGGSLFSKTLVSDSPADLIGLV